MLASELTTVLSTPLPSWKFSRRPNLLSRYLIRVPASWDSSKDPRPIVFIHGLGLGLLQYTAVLSHMYRNFADRPILVVLQPQISQDFFHPAFLKPMSRHETADALAALLVELSWVDQKTAEVDDDLLSSPAKGVTMISHSK